MLEEEGPVIVGWQTLPCGASPWGAAVGTGWAPLASRLKCSSALLIRCPHPLTAPQNILVMKSKGPSGTPLYTHRGA